jgi:PHD/YefM family antitoxin component YafN of YafNO toxin-antitoxin module
VTILRSVILDSLTDEDKLLYESLVETLDILSDEELMVAIRQGIQEAEAGQGIPWEQARQQLDL